MSVSNAQNAASVQCWINTGALLYAGGLNLD